MKRRSRRTRRSWTTSVRTRSTRWSSSWRSKRSLESRFRTRTPRRSPGSRKPSTTSKRTARERSSHVGGMVSRRVVITGIGLVSSLGIGTSANWSALVSGTSGVTRITKFDVSAFATQIAAEVKGFDPLQFVEKKDVKKMDVFIQYAVAASQFAMEDAKLPITGANAANVGVFVGSGIGGFTSIEREHKALLAGGPRKISPFFIPASIINLAAGQVSIRFGAK